MEGERQDFYLVRLHLGTRYEQLILRHVLGTRTDLAKSVAKDLLSRPGTLHSERMVEFRATYHPMELDRAGALHIWI